MKVQFKVKLKNKQKEIYNVVKDKKNRYITVLMARQTGKSVLASILTIEALITNPNGNVIYICPSYTLARKIYREITKALRSTGLIKSSNGSLLTLTLTNESQLQFFSAESPNSLRGQTCKTLLIIDEAAFMPETIPSGENFFSNIILPIGKVHKPTTLLISTPSGKQGFFYDFYLRGESNEEGYKSIIGTIYDDETMTERDIADLKSTMPPLAWEQEFECKFLDSSLTALQGFENCFERNVEVDNKDKVWIGVDFSSVGEDETILTAVNAKGHVKQYKIDGDLDQKYRKIASLIDSYPNLQIANCELNSIGEVMLNEIKKLTRQKSKIRGFVTTNQSKKDAVGILQTLIANKEIHFDENDKELFQQCGVFVYTITKAKNITYAAKPPYHDDRILSLCMAVKAKDEYHVLDAQRDIIFTGPKLKIIG